MIKRLEKRMVETISITYEVQRVIIAVMQGKNVNILRDNKGRRDHGHHHNSHLLLIVCTKCNNVFEKHKHRYAGREKLTKLTIKCPYLNCGHHNYIYIGRIDVFSILPEKIYRHYKDMFIEWYITPSNSSGYKHPDEIEFIELLFKHYGDWEEVQEIMLKLLEPKPKKVLGINLCKLRSVKNAV